MPRKKLRVAVLFGGQSGEHEVSLISAQSVMKGLEEAKYTVVPVGITKDGRWISGQDAHAALLATADQSLLPGGGDMVSTDAMLELRTRSFPVLGASEVVDVVFPVLHGPMGEDGTVQGVLELAGVPYVGCGVAASAVGMDKALMKAAFAAAGLPLLPWMLVRRFDLERDAEQVYTQIESQLRYPVFVKPANMGSSVGISKAKDRAGLVQALATAARYDRRIVIEQGIAAREIEVSVLGNDEPEASLPGEVIPSGEWYDYEAKYLSGGSQIVIPANISPELIAQVQDKAKQAFLSINGSGLSRVDFLLDKETGELWLNEVNTLPGFTSVSMYAKMWEVSGLPYVQLLDRLIKLAFERWNTTPRIVENE